MKRCRFPIAFAVFVAAAMLGGCGGESVGNTCEIAGVDDDDLPDDVSDISTPALECTSRTCLYTPLEIPEEDLPEGSEHAPLCTAECETDSDCARDANSPCQEGFTCAVARHTGEHCCRSYCICKDYLDDVPEGGFERPAVCDPDDENNLCCNLPGREDEPHCQ